MAGLNVRRRSVMARPRRDFSLERMPPESAASGRRTGLKQRCRPGKRLKTVARRSDAVNGRDFRDSDLENAGHHDDAGKAYVGNRRRLAVAESAGFRRAGQTLLECLQASGEPMDLPYPPCSVIDCTSAAQVLPDPGRDQRVRVGGQHGGQ